MRKIVSSCRRRTWVAAVLLSISAVGCNGGGAVAPVVMAVTPVKNATEVVTYNTVITATFNEPISAITGGASFTVTCAAPCVSPTGTVALDATNTIATFRLKASTGLAAQTLYTATITGATGSGSGLALASPYVCRFTTGAAPPAPTVTAVDPLDNAIGVPINDSIDVTFSEAMAPITGTASFTVSCAAPCVSPTGAVALDTAQTIPTFTLGAGKTLTASTLYTATITGAISLTSGVALASPYVWHFTTGATADTTRPTVLLTEPATTIPGPTPGVAANSAVIAAFSEDMAPATFNASSFTVTCAAPCVSPTGTVTYDTTARTAVFTPATALTVGATYTATITTLATDLARNALAANYLWTFTTVAAGAPSHLTVVSTNPTSGALGVCPGASVNATFAVSKGLRMDPSRVNGTTFTLT